MGIPKKESSLPTTCKLKEMSAVVTSNEHLCRLRGDIVRCWPDKMQNTGRRVFTRKWGEDEREDVTS